ncbi:class D sortase [Candidatus Halobeggiatoa sp. HSG11]|nr:class D sortase [Candidatus Halobeggiatoa sp. HSG11]
MKKPLKWGGIFLIIAICLAIWQFDREHDASAWVAHNLLHTAWVRTQSSGRQVEPWPWANTWPLARVSVPRLKLERIVLSNADNGMSAFALGHSKTSVLPGEFGNSVLNIIHRNTLSKFLQVLKLGDTLVLESIHSGRWHYQISAIYIVGKTETNLVEPSLNRRLTLVSCYPCDNTNTQRYVVVAEEVERVISIVAKP